MATEEEEETIGAPVNVGYGAICEIVKVPDGYLWRIRPVEPAPDEGSAGFRAGRFLGMIANGGSDA